MDVFIKTSVGVLVLGLIIMVLGTYANLQVAESSIEHYDDEYTQERIDRIVEDFFENRDKDDIFMKPQSNEDIEEDPPFNMPLNIESKNSEIQPPNPVPPESHSNEKLALTKNFMKSEAKANLLPVSENKEPIVKVSEIHPRNLKTKLETKLANGISNGAVEAQKPKEEKAQSNEDKIALMKQQQLIETIKQHCQEQKEMNKEQKEILDEIMKTKKELQQNKNEAVEANEAKKIAGESFKQIADMAIKNIGGVSEKPDLVKNEVKAVKLLEKLTIDTVQEIAKKAVEIIEAIQDITEKPEQQNAAQLVQNNVPIAQANPAQNVQVNPAHSVQVNPPQNVQVNPAQNVQVNPAQNVQTNQNIQVNPAFPHKMFKQILFRMFEPTHYKSYSVIRIYKQIPL